MTSQPPYYWCWCNVGYWMTSQPLYYWCWCSVGYQTTSQSQHFWYCCGAAYWNSGWCQSLCSTAVVLVTMSQPPSLVTEQCRTCQPRGCIQALILLILWLLLLLELLLVGMMLWRLLLVGLELQLALARRFLQLRHTLAVDQHLEHWLFADVLHSLLVGHHCEVLAIQLHTQNPFSMKSLLFSCTHKTLKVWSLLPFSCTNKIYQLWSLSHSAGYTKSINYEVFAFQLHTQNSWLTKLPT